MNPVEFRAAKRAGLLEDEDPRVFCFYLERIILFLKDLQARTPGWKLWYTLGMGAAIGALEALQAAQCGRHPFQLE